MNKELVLSSLDETKQLAVKIASFLKEEINSSNRVLGMKITHWSIILMAILNIITVIVRVIL